jgi:hypothetical protein
MPGSYKPKKGHCLLIPSGTSFHPGRQHLFVFLTNACPANSHLAVSFSTVRQGIAHDSTCIIEVGEHSWVESQSYIFYAKPQQLFRPNIVKCIDGRIYTPKDDCSASLLERICKGLMESAFTPRWAKEYFRINGDCGFRRSRPCIPI